ncbi:MAG: hypothetical protein ACYTE3_02145 [Planctomycetota bacterium]
MVAYTKRQVIDLIHLLLAKQIKKTGSIRARCVLRDGRIMLIARQCTLATDLVIIDHVVSPDIVPLRTVIHQGVDEHWDALNGIHITAPNALLQRQ